MSPKLRIRAGSLRHSDRGSTTSTWPPVSARLLREQPVLGDYRPTDYVERRDWAQADDGARIPVSIVHRAGIEFPAPALLYGYGAYEICTDPSFSIARLSLLDRGMVFVDRPCPRRRRDGPTVVRARQAAGEEEHLHRLRRGGTASGGLGADPTASSWWRLGGSAGGLLVGAVANYGTRALRRNPRAGARSSIR